MSATPHRDYQLNHSPLPSPSKPEAKNLLTPDAKYADSVKLESLRLLEESKAIEELHDSEDFFASKRGSDGGGSASKNMSLFSIINKKQENLSRRDALPQHNTKQPKPVNGGRADEAKDSFLKNFQLDYVDQAEKAEKTDKLIKESELLVKTLQRGSRTPHSKGVGRVILNRALIGNSETPDKQGDQTSGSRDLQIKSPLNLSGHDHKLDLSMPKSWNTDEFLLSRRAIGQQSRRNPMSVQALLHPPSTLMSSSKASNDSGNGGNYSIHSLANFLIVLTCMICYNTSNDNDRVICSSKCGHIACEECWLIWFKTKLECPMCKSKARPKTLVKLFPNGAPR